MKQTITNALGRSPDRTDKLYKRLLQREEYIKMGYDPDKPLAAQKVEKS